MSSLSKRVFFFVMKVPMAWVVSLHERIHFGPAPGSKEDMEYLHDILHVNCIVNLRPLSNRKTKADYDTTEWYRDIIKKQEWGTHVVRLEISSDYIRMAQHVLEFLNQSDGVVIYIHNVTGFVEEAFVALLLWKLSGLSKEKDPSEWLEKNYYGKVLEDPEQRKQLGDLWKEVQQLARMRGFFTKKSKN